MNTRVLFVCSANTTRSQMAQALLLKYGKEDFDVDSAGINPGVLNPLAVEVILEDEDMDISSYTTNKVLDYYKEGRHYHYVITVCDEASKEPCPIFPSLDGVLHWNITSPASNGTNEEKKAKIRVSKEEIKTNVLKLIELVKEKHIKIGFHKRGKNKFYKDKKMKKVLILCTGNSCRSIIAEALINAKLDGISADSSGVRASGRVNPNAKKLLEEKGIWKEEYHSKTIDTVINNEYDLVVTVCDHANETCPMFPKAVKVIHVGFEDPDGKGFEAFEDTYKEIEEVLLPKVVEALN